MRGLGQWVTCEIFDRFRVALPAPEKWGAKRHVRVWRRATKKCGATPHLIAIRGAPGRVIGRGAAEGGARWTVAQDGSGAKAEARAELARANLALYRAEGRLRRAVLKALRAGVGLREVARLSGLSTRTVGRWRDGTR